MRVKDKQKICSHCEGRISVEADTCLYCGMPLLEERKEEAQSVDIMSSLQGGIPSLYPPLYSQKGESGERANQESIYKVKAPYLQQEEAKPLEVKDDERSSFISILLALLGSSLFILGLMQGFFSEGGVLQLEWNSRYWFLYLLLAAPMLYMGLKEKNQTK